MIKTANLCIESELHAKAATVGTLGKCGHYEYIKTRHGVTCEHTASDAREEALESGSAAMGALGLSFSREHCLRAERHDVRVEQLLLVRVHASCSRKTQVGESNGV